MDNALGRTTNSCLKGEIGVALSSLQHATKASRQNQDDGAAMLLSFPATRNILWDKRPMGTPIILHGNHYRNPTLVIEEKTLRLAHRFTQDSNCDTYSCLFLASLSTDGEREGICINIDRFEASSGSSGVESTDGIAIPCLVKKNSAKPKTSVEDYGNSLKRICERCRSKRKVRLEDFISVHAYCSYHENQQNFLFHMDFTMVTSGVKFKLTPVNSIPVVPTALSKNLAGPLSVSHLHGEPKSGYLTMDQTRKLLLVLESDPKAPTLPLVGIWISGVQHVRDPFVWACCLRYIFNADLKDRIVAPPESFVVAVYTPVHSKPEFYECVTVNGQVMMQFDLGAGHEVIQLPKDCLGRAQSPLEMELLSVESGEKRDLFEAAIENNKSLLIDQSNLQNSERTSASEDIMPRSIPAPHYGKQASMIRPSVPEVSLLLDENEGNFLPRPVPIPTRMSKANVYPHQGKPKKKSKGQKLPMQSSSEPVSPLIDNYHPGPAQKPSSVPVSPAAPQYRPGMTYPPPGMNQPYPQGPFPSPYNRGFQPYTMGPQHVPPSVPVYSHQQHQMSYPAYQYNGFHNMTTPPQMQIYPQPNGPYPGPSSLQWNVNMYKQNQSPNQPEHHPQNLPQNTHFPNGKAQQSEQPPQGNQEGLGGNTVGGMLPMQYADNTKTRPMSSHKLPNHTSPPGQKGRLPNGGCEDEETLLKQGGVSPSRQSMPGSVEGSPHQQSGSTDSGLHVSDSADPDALLMNHSMESLKSSAGNSSQVPADVYELLKMQDMQLKMLREQLSQLLAKQGQEPSGEATITTAADVSGAVPPPSLDSRVMSHDMATQSSLAGTPVRKASGPQMTNKCTTAVNTSLWYPEPEQVRRDTTAQQGGCHSFNLTTQDISIQAGHLDCEESSNMPGRLKSPQLRLKDRGMYEQEGGHNMTSDTMSFGELQLTSIQDRTEESIMSEMVVDMPAYNSGSPEKHSSSGCTDDESNRSPQLGESVSMYERNFGDTEESLESRAGAKTNPHVNLLFNNQKQFYQNLMGGVQKFLAKSVDSANETDLQNATEQMASTQEVSTPQGAKYGNSSLQRSRSEPCDMQQAAERGQRQQESFVEREPVNVEEMTREQLKHLGISMEQMACENSNPSSLFLDPVMLPKISYVSLMLDSESEYGAEADALAMKYLTDEQLTELAKVRMNASINRRSRDLDGLVTPATSHLAPSPGKPGNLTFMGSNHMSFASKKYLERYGLSDSTQDTKSQAQPNSSTTNAGGGDAILDRTPAKESSFNVRQFLQKLSEKSLMGDMSVPKASEIGADETTLNPSNSMCTRGESLSYTTDSFTALQGKPMSTPAEHHAKPATFDAYADQTPVRLKPPQNGGGGLDSGSIGAQEIQGKNYEAHGYSPMNGAAYKRPGSVRKQTARQNPGGQEKPAEQGPQNPGTPKSSNKVLDIEMLRELPKLL